MPGDGLGFGKTAGGGPGTGPGTNGKRCRDIYYLYAADGFSDWIGRALSLSAQRPPIWSVCAALALLAAITAVVVVSRHQRPYLLMGWLWYLGMLVPAIGIIQISYYSHADRYTYLPEIGLAVAVTWAVADLSVRWKHRRIMLGILTTAVMSALMVCGYVQTSYWADGEVWWPHTLACTSSNSIAYLDWGDLLHARGKLDEAAARYREALAIQPHSVEIINNLGNVLAMKGQQADALAQYQKALAERPDFADTRVNLGNLLMNTNLDAAIAEYRKALDLAPDKVEIRNNLGKALGMKGDDAGAIDQYQRILAIEPKYANAHFNLGNRLLKVGRYEEAAGQYREALTLQPNDSEARTKLGKALLLKGDFESAMTCFEKTMPLSGDLAQSLLILGNYFLQNADWPTAIACYRQSLKISPRSADACGNLGTALCRKGDYGEAIDAWKRSLEINPDNILVLNNLAHFLAAAPDVSLRDGAKAVVLATKADQLSGGANPVVLETLAAAYEQAGSVKQAAETARRALDLALAQNNRALATTLKKEIILYETNAPAPSGAR
jgi:tetratricopeptide (TPR) repeat protein